MTTPFFIGLSGSIILILGAALPDYPQVSPARCLKNQLFAGGGLIMLLYAWIKYTEGGSFFFVVLQLLVNLSSIFMLLDTDDRIDVPVISTAGAVLMVWCLFFFQGISTVFFVLGLGCIAVGYATRSGTHLRYIALTAGSALIAVFSFFSREWIFFWLNVSFALFSSAPLWNLLRSTAVHQSSSRGLPGKTQCP